MGWTIRGSNPDGVDIFSTRLDRPSSPPGLLYNGYRVLLEGVKLPGRGVNHLSPSSAEFRERVVISLFSFWAFMAYSRAKFASFFFTLSAKFTGFVLEFCFATRLVVGNVTVDPGSKPDQTIMLGGETFKDT